MMGFDWEEHVFRWVLGAWRLAKPEKIAPQQQKHSVDLSSLQNRLLVLGQIMAGMPIRIRTAEAHGGVKGPVLLLPAAIWAGPNVWANILVYRLRTMIHATLCRQRWEPLPPSRGQAQQVAFLFAIQRAVAYLTHRFEGFSACYQQALAWDMALRPPIQSLPAELQNLEALIQKLAAGVALQEATELKRFRRPQATKKDLPPLFLWGDVLTGNDHQQALDAANELLREAGEGSELQSPARDSAVRTWLEQVDNIDPIPIHTFEKTETLDDYAGGAREFDGSDELDEHQAALNELKPRHVIRGGCETKGFFKADLDLDGGVPDVHHIFPDERGIKYPEWHCRTKSYRRDWATVYPVVVQQRCPQLTAQILRKKQRLIDAMVRQLWAYRNRYARLNRQPYGDEIDLDAVVQAYADRQAGLAPSSRLYQMRRRTQPGTAVTLLLDVSLSSGSWVEGQRVLDLTREAVLVFGEVAHQLGDHLRILCFASNTRNHCRVFHMKEWRESWPAARDRICALEPQGYTRMGPALRHAIAGFEDAPATRRLLLLVTDGKPTDYDRYEGLYGLEDVRMAVKEGQDLGIHTAALGLDPKARANMPRMFGVRGWHVLKHVSELCHTMTRVYGQLASR